METISEPLPGVHLLRPKVFFDERGNFVKTYNNNDFKLLGLDFEPVEEYYSTSKVGVLRGMHFQLPPHDLAKLVYCIRGRVLDVLVDLRKHSGAFGKWASMELSELNRLQLFMPSGIAHGFLSLEEESVMVYKTTSVHAPSHDSGIRWDSFGFDWPVPMPLISKRDTAFSPFSEFTSPF